MKIAIFTIDEIEFVPTLLKRVLDCKDYEVTCVFVSNSFLDYKKLLKKIRFFAKNHYPFCIRLSDLVRYACWRFRLKLFGANGYKNVNSFMEHRKIPCHQVKDINDPKFIEELKKIDADLFLFAPFDQIAKRDFIQIPPMGTLNVHLGKLPEYKGGLSAFWVLRFQDTEAGVTVHYVNEKIDEGKKLVECRFPYKTNNMKILLGQTVDEASKTLLKGLNGIKYDQRIELDSNNSKPNYFFMPSREDFREFYKNGNRLI